MSPQTQRRWCVMTNPVFLLMRPVFFTFQKPHICMPGISCAPSVSPVPTLLVPSESLSTHLLRKAAMPRAVGPVRGRGEGWRAVGGNIHIQCTVA